MKKELRDLKLSRQIEGWNVDLPILHEKLVKKADEIETKRQTDLKERQKVYRTQMDKIQEQWHDDEKMEHKLHPELDLLELATRISISRAAIKERVVPPEYISQSTEIIGYEWAHDGVKVVIPDMASLLKDFGRTTRKDADDRNFYFGNDLIIEGDAEKKEDKKSYQIRERNRIINKSRKIFDEENTYNITPEEEKKCQKMFEKYKKKIFKTNYNCPTSTKRR